MAALAEKMKGNGSQSKSNEFNTKGLVMKDEPWLQNQPKESVLLFPGADATTPLNEPQQPQHKLIVHCDECQTEIQGKVYCCKVCFDYDLCGGCYPRASLTHADGKHDFALER